MKMRVARSVWVAVAAAAGLVLSVSAAQAPPNTLTAAERAAGWRLLFDGQTISEWRVFNQQAVSDGWQVVDGTLARVARGRDLITKEQFADFEFAFDWKLGAPGANSGIMFRVAEGPPQTYHTGPEMQLLDNANHADGKVPETSVGANYALHAPTRDTSKPVGEWNTAKLLVHGARVEHWLNGEKVVEYELWTSEWTAKVAASKFVQWPQYGLAQSGHIAIQDHGNPVSFRNLKVRVLR